MTEEELEGIKTSLKLEEKGEKGEELENEGDGEIYGDNTRNQDQVDEIRSFYTRVSKNSVRSNKTGGTFRSSKTYISHLEKKLNLEREAREKLQLEVEELKRISS